MFFSVYIFMADDICNTIVRVFDYGRKQTLQMNIAEAGGFIRKVMAHNLLWVFHICSVVTAVTIQLNPPPINGV